MESADSAIKQTAAAPAVGVAACGGHITGQMSDDRTLAEAYISRISFTSNSQLSPADRDSSHFLRPVSSPPLLSSCHGVTRTTEIDSVARP